MSFKQSVTRVSCPYHVWSEEGRYHRDGHHDWVEELTDDPERQSKRRDDECKLTDLGQTEPADLRHREAALHGRLERLAAY